MKTYFVSDDNRLPVRVLDDNAAERMKRAGKIGILLKVEGEIHEGRITATTVGRTTNTTERAIASLQRMFHVRRLRPHANNTLARITTGAA
jgi:hypothetical protein